MLDYLEAEACERLDMPAEKKSVGQPSTSDLILSAGSENEMKNRGTKRKREAVEEQLSQTQRVNKHKTREIRKSTERARHLGQIKGWLPEYSTKVTWQTVINIASLSAPQLELPQRYLLLFCPLSSFFSYFMWVTSTESNVFQFCNSLYSLLLFSFCFLASSSSSLSSLYLLSSTFPSRALSLIHVERTRSTALCPHIQPSPSPSIHHTTLPIIWVGALSSLGQEHFGAKVTFMPHKAHGRPHTSLSLCFSPPIHHTTLRMFLTELANWARLPLHFERQSA